MLPDARRNRYLEKQLTRIAEEGRGRRIEAALKNRKIQRDLELLQRQQETSTEPAADAPLALYPLTPKWCELPGEHNDLLEAELRRARYEWKHIQDRSLCSTVQRVEKEMNVKFDDIWNLESELSQASVEGEVRDLTEENIAWLRKHQDLADRPRELHNWCVTLEARERALLPEWTDTLIRSRIEKNSCISTFPSIELEERLGIAPIRKAHVLDDAGISPFREALPSYTAVTVARPCEVERELEERLGLSSSCRVADGDVWSEALGNEQLEREIEARLGLSAASELG